MYWSIGQYIFQEKRWTSETAIQLTADDQSNSPKGRRVMIAFFVNYSTVAFPLHWPTLKWRQFLGAVANSLEKDSYFPLFYVLYCIITKILSLSRQYAENQRDSMAKHSVQVLLVSAHSILGNRPSLGRLNEVLCAALAKNLHVPSHALAW